MAPAEDPIVALARELRSQATASGQRRAIVVHGERSAGASLVQRILDALGIDPEACRVVSDAEELGFEVPQVGLDASGELLGTTQQLLVLDAHDAFPPNVLGRTVGTVDGGGLLILLTPTLTDWPKRRDGFDAHLAVPPYEVEDVGGRFRRRLVDTLLRHEGIAIVDAEAERIEAEGTVDETGSSSGSPGSAPPGERFPEAAYGACRTADQARAVRAFEGLEEPQDALVLEADRGRGKSSAAGLAAACLAREGHRVLVTAPRFGNASEVLARARELAARLELATEASEDGHALSLEGGGSIRYRRPAEALEQAGQAGLVIVDEAAALPVRLLEDLLAAQRPTAFVTTIHGYEGAGRGFSVRFKDRLTGSERTVTELTLSDPIRYAAGDPIERWAFDALLLDARPAVDPVVEGADPASITYERLEPEHLLEDEPLLREAFGLLVLAHYRTTPDDLARLLDAPNLSTHVLLHEGHVVSVALAAEEGGLGPETRERIYEGERIRGHLIPDVLTSQLRDPQAAEPTGARIARIATHPALRREGLASRLLDEIAQRSGADWLGAAFGATPGLVRFWAENGHRCVHLSTRRNEASGEHSAFVLDPMTEAGRRLAARSSRFFARRIGSVLTDALRGVDPDIVRACLAATDAEPALEISEREWRLAAAAAYGPGMMDLAPRPFRRLALKQLVEHPGELEPDAERLLVAKVLQARPWEAVADELGYLTRRQAMLAAGEAFQPLVDRYGGKVAEQEADRYR